MKKESSGATFMKTKSSGADAMFMKRAPEAQLCLISEGSTALKKSALQPIQSEKHRDDPE